jgi:hypothetical protein
MKDRHTISPWFFLFVKNKPGKTDRENDIDSIISK